MPRFGGRPFDRFAERCRLTSDQERALRQLRDAGEPGQSRRALWYKPETRAMERRGLAEPVPTRATVRLTALGVAMLRQLDTMRAAAQSPALVWHDAASEPTDTGATD